MPHQAPDGALQKTNNIDPLLFAVIIADNKNNHTLAETVIAMKIRTFSLPSTMNREKALQKICSRLTIWFSLATAQGDINAQEDMNKLETELTPAKIAEAQKRATDFHANLQHTTP